MPTFQDLFDKYAFHAFEKQRRLSLLLGEHQWLLNSEEATITFSARFVFPVQFLGTESERTHTWLWADSNDTVLFPTGSLEFCRRVRAAGRMNGIAEFAIDRFALAEEVGTADGHSLAIVATCLGSGSCYYRCPHDNGAVFVAINDPGVDSQPDLDGKGFHEAFTNLMWLPGNMKERIISYLSDKGYIDETSVGESLDCELYTGERIALRFEQTEDGGTKISLLEDLG